MSETVHVTELAETEGALFPWSELQAILKRMK